MPATTCRMSLTAAFAAACVICLMGWVRLTEAAPASAPATQRAVFQITDPKPEAQLKPGQPIRVQGTHRLPVDSCVWIFLRDSFGGYYLQNPAVELLPDGKFRQDNVRPGKGIRYITAIQVDAEGDKQIRRWVEVSAWGKISRETIKGLSGYKALSEVPVKTSD